MNEHNGQELKPAGGYREIGEKITGKMISSMSLKDRVLLINLQTDGKTSGSSFLEVSAAGSQRLNLRLFSESGVIRE